ncbi:MAG TPA: glutaredoxin family protein [Dehalococcoidia bacterium]|jgi:glutaredoxin
MSGEPLRLLSRRECGLCEDMARDLRRLKLAFVEIDVDEDEALEREYGEVIPVLMLGDREIARAPQIERTLREVLSRAGLLSALT